MIEKDGNSKLKCHEIIDTDKTKIISKDKFSIKFNMGPAHILES